MNRTQLEHVLRAAAEIVPDGDILVIGSQAVLAALDEAVLPPEATRSIEVDLAFFDDPDEAKADAVDGAIGELSRFHRTFGYYGQGVSLGTAVLPAGWRRRLRRVPGTIAAGPERRVRCLEPHDCVASKLVAGREKDREFAVALLRAGLIDPSMLAARIDDLPASVSPSRRAALHAWLQRAIDR